jgi:hypothetical protein
MRHQPLGPFVLMQMAAGKKKIEKELDTSIVL